MQVRLSLRVIVVYAYVDTLVFIIIIIIIPFTTRVANSGQPEVPCFS